ncbi:MAG: hypothetical protein LC689_09075, partial [Myxococcales bacterium]|nr:hypothetical protein [Myxococcales bacterium]
MLIWVPTLACLSLIVYLLVQHASVSKDASGKRLALLVGARRAWGDSDASLRQRSIDLSRWPYKENAPEFVWWARLWRRIWR